MPGHTSITKDMWREHPQLQHLGPAPADVYIKGASGQKVPYLDVVPISLTILGITYDDIPVFVVRTDSYRRRVPVLIGTNIIRASKRDQQTTAWHTANIHTVVPESGDKQGRVGYAKYARRFCLAKFNLVVKSTSFVKLHQTQVAYLIQLLSKTFPKTPPP